MSTTEASPTITRQQLKAAFDDVMARYDRWRSADAPSELYMGQPVKPMTEDVIEALDAFGAARDIEDVPDDVKPIILVIDVMDDEFQAWLSARSVAPESVFPGGTAELRSAIDAVADSFTVKPRKLPESITSLVDKGVGLVQIAKIYGFLDEDGDPDTAMVMEEMREPGTHYNPETWVSAAERRRQREVAEQWARRDHVPFDRITDKHDKPRRIAPEPLDQLIAANVPSQQIAKMKGIDLEEVEQRAAELGIALDGRFRHPVAGKNDHREQQHIAQERQDAYAESHPEVDNMEDRILACHLDGMKPNDIATAMRQDYPALTWQKALAVIRASDAPPSGSPGEEPQKTA